mgnify:CR=1 FL=1|jgi:hypothetical protein
MDERIKFVLALRYLYYCKYISLVDDYTYDMYEKEAMALEGGEVLDCVSSDMEESYSDEIKEKAQSLLDEYYNI